MPRSAHTVLQCITAEVAAGRTDLPLSHISDQTRYSVPTVRQAIRRLRDDGFIRVTPGRGARCPQRYAVLSDRQRRTILLARAAGIIE